ncbi:MAG TPA: pantoate--beta-alanine ligase [Oceanobacillus sp.]|nr:pantoate--beta-alanine ligase [Oceanobacillus sp.]
MGVQVVETPEALRAVRRRLAGYIGAVYTMGALHEGHLSLLNTAREENDALIASIFINPTQFAPGEDYANYPRTLERDLELMDRAGVDVVFTPSPQDMYLPFHQTSVIVDEVSQGLEGASRPNHFRGVATVVAKLFNLTQPTTAYFGQKDAQQVVVIRRMVRDLNIPVEIAVCPTVREPDGLAMSSRNAYLKPDERKAAASLYRALKAAADAYDHGERDPSVLRMIACEELYREPLAIVDYVAINHPHTLYGVHEPTDEPILLSMAVKIGAPRLLDNCLLPYSLNNREHLTEILGVV